MIDTNTTKSARSLALGRFFSFTLLLLALNACGNKQHLVQIYGEAQGTYYSVQYYADAQRPSLRPQIDSLLSDFDQTASLWVDSSLLRRINDNRTDTVNPVFADMLTKSMQITDYTNGAFDCRVGRIVQAWGFSFKQREEPDSSALVDLMRAAHGSVSIRDGHIVKQFADTEIDFNAIAQGYSVDMLAAMLDRYGISSYLIDVGGEVIAKGVKPNGSPWRVGIERPAEDKDSAPVVQTAIALRDCSVVTSGNYRKYYERDGVRYSHTIDPTTARPVQHSLLSVSVVEETSWLADAMATAYMVMGLERAKAFIAEHQGQPGTEAVMFIYDDGGELRTYATPAFDAMIINQ